ncbi:hypothetical protein VTO42DRAFT_7690 [Malbranchea cinnamomea]
MVSGGLKASLLGALSTLGAANVVTAATHCKVLPGDANWPTQAEWDALNREVGGRLLGPVVPLSAPCHDNPAGLGEYNEAECKSITDNWTKPQIHIEHPTDIMSPLFSNNTCLYSTDKTSPCTIGYYPVYVVNVSAPEHAAAAVRFASEKNLRLNIKNTGHDFLGRSTGRGALSVWTAHLKDIEIIDKYTGGTPYSGSAVKVGAGVSSQEIYEATDKVGKMVVGGEQPTVGFGGGYMAGGGHSPLSSLHGMAVDAVLEFDIVLANGTLITVDQKNNPDLYWAVRGAGISSYGVVVSWTLRTFDTVPTTVIRLSFASSDENKYWEAVSKFIEIGPSMTDKGIYSYYFPEFNNTKIAPVFAPKLTISEVDALLKPLYDVLEKNEIPYVRNASHYDTFLSAWRGAPELPSFDPEPVGGQSILMSRLIPRQTVENNLAGVVEQFKKFSKLTDGQGHCVVFNQAPTLAAGGEFSDNAVNPAWRKAAIHFITSWRQTADDPVPVIEEKRREYVLNTFQSMRDLCPDSGAYINEASTIEPNFQQAFYGGGERYKRLLRIKKKYDPNSVFWATAAVGSEEWIENDGVLCRKQC